MLNRTRAASAASLLHRAACASVLSVLGPIACDAEPTPTADRSEMSLEPVVDPQVSSRLVAEPYVERLAVEW
jgi:hypothetical protein